MTLSKTANAILLCAGLVVIGAFVGGSASYFAFVEAAVIMSESVVQLCQ